MGPLVHFELTRDWARETGLDAVAERIALADASVDVEFPARGSLLNLTRHFAPWAYGWVWYYRRRALRMRSPEALGRALHAAQDAVAHGVFGLAHVRFDLKIGRNPDDWEAAPSRVRDRIQERTLRILRAYRSSL
ncbi:MAG: hypothetical protein CVT66_02285 [Actinobacteria bacterium HGW-Actinobacteria-6]|nr:MAG: hypothetical protein CVT66_02285 [Actinobacteria bacterium HGW-Actinobacteria-6]